MIIHLARFLETGRPAWIELAGLLDRLENNPETRLELDEVKRLHHLYRRVSADLVKIATFSAEPEVRRHLEALVGRAYAEIHQQKRENRRFHPLRWLCLTFPATFRRHFAAFLLASGMMLGGSATGWFFAVQEPETVKMLVPFPQLHQTPSQRVAEEEKGRQKELSSHHLTFSSQLMANNIRVAILAMVLGVTWGAGTILALFYNGVILGVISQMYVADGQAAFLAGWLLPHGSVELPAILVGGQAGLVLAGALIGRGSRQDLRSRLHAVLPGLLTLTAGAAVMLVWAGLVESFISQYHWPVLPYGLKIGLGLAELAGLAAFLGWSGRRSGSTSPFLPPAVSQRTFLWFRRKEKAGAGPAQSGPADGSGS